jgi:hypothetical protein
VRQPLTLKHLVNTQRPPLGCLVFCWTHYTYASYLRVGDPSTGSGQDTNGNVTQGQLNIFGIIFNQQNMLEGVHIYAV